MLYFKVFLRLFFILLICFRWASLEAKYENPYNSKGAVPVWIHADRITKQQKNEYFYKYQVKFETTDGGIDASSVDKIVTANSIEVFDRIRLTPYDTGERTILKLTYRNHIYNRYGNFLSKENLKFLKNNFKFARLNDPGPYRWINFHVCKPAKDVVYNGMRIDKPKDYKLLKVGTSDVAKFWNTLQGEMEGGVRRSYAFCNPNEIFIYTFRGLVASTIEGNANDFLEKCLRRYYRPASEEIDTVPEVGLNDGNDPQLRKDCGKLKTIENPLIKMMIKVES